MNEAGMNSMSWTKTSDQYGYYKIGKSETAGYASIDFAMNLVFQCIALYISYFYTDIFGIKPGHVAILFLVSRFWDAVNDPMMGTIIERLSPKKGKYWPYIMWGSVPFGVVAVLTFTTPNFSYGFKLAWAAITYNLLNMLYTFIIQPYISAASLMTNDQGERTRLQSTRMMLAQTGGVVCAIMLPTLSNFLTKYMSLQAGYMTTTAIMAVAMIAILMWGSNQIIEKIPAQPIDIHNKANAKDVFRIWFTMKPIFITFILFLGVYSFSQIQATMGAYYIKYFANREDLISLFSVMMMLPSVFGVPCVPFLTKKLTKKGTVFFGLTLAALGSLLLFFMPQNGLTGMMVARIISSFGYGVLMGILWSIITDPVEYVHWKTGKRYTAICMTVMGLGIKFGMVIGGTVPNAVMERVGYVANEIQSQPVLNAIRSLTSLLPFAVVVAVMFIYGIFYDINEEKVMSMQAEIAERFEKEKVVV